MKKLFVCLFAAGMLGFTSITFAADAKVDPQQADVLRSALQRARPGLPVGEIRNSPVSGLYEVEAGKDNVLMTQDGKYLVSGTVYRLEDNRLVNLTEERLKPVRASRLAAVKKEDMIVFSPKGPVKAYVDVFTDVDCGFCRKLHKEVPALNAMGIEVRYLAFPRAGVPSPSADKLATAWCADNRQDMLTRMKNGDPMPIKVCEKNPVAAEFRLGNELGVNGTPAIFKPDGTLLPGYMPAAELAASLGVQVPANGTQPPATLAAPH
ncbi:MAG TPA: DsbC family protein [Pseudomonadales bacterium]|nr:DsbC family protein [Pseudomonadales bacterium]